MRIQVEDLKINLSTIKMKNNYQGRKFNEFKREFLKIISFLSHLFSVILYYGPCYTKLTRCYVYITLTLNTINNLHYAYMLSNRYFLHTQDSFLISYLNFLLSVL
jgi:hypothetical protein